VATALLNELVESDVGVSRFTVNALENAPSGSGASAAAIADAVWDELQSGHTTAGTFGEIATEIASILLDTNELQGDDIPTLIAALPTQAEITGGAYALDTDANGRMRIVDGTGIGELDTASGLIAGIAGTIQTLDALDTAQDTQHAATIAAIAALNNLSWADIWTGTAFTEDYAADGILPTPAQAMQAIEQSLNEIGYSGTTATIGRRDGTAAYTATLDDATNPTSIKRSV
jgi:hypothetical protein